MHPEESTPRDKEIGLSLWRRLLIQSRPEALAKIDGVIARLTEARTHYSEIARYRAQMLNGAATPEDFATGLFGTSARA